jgi:hypothetical protein
MFVSDPSFAASATRQQVWSDYARAYATLNPVVPVLAAWIGGSFSTGKMDPDDIDVVWIVDRRRYAALAPPQRAAVAIFGQGKLLRQKTGARVDTFMLMWEPVPVPDVGANVDHASLAASRGYWDDLWLRQIQGPKTLRRTNADTPPRRGYLEVTYRAYL